MRKRIHFDSDVTRRNDGAYWAAALVLAVRAQDGNRVALAERELKRLGVPIMVAGKAKGAGDAK